MELEPCPFCGYGVEFHHDDECDGCHNIICINCRAFVDLSSYADPGNESETLEVLRGRIAVKWNQRFAAQNETKL